jgi:uncharacterized Zn finger protein
MKFTKILTLDTVKSLAGEKTFARGLAYFHNGVVGRMEQIAEEDEETCSLSADVQGTHRYHVTLSVDEEGEFFHDCDCPVGSDGIFCKHAVAVALSWIENSGEEVFRAEEEQKPRRARITKAEQLRQYLDTLPEAELRELLMEAADRDRSFRDRLLFAAKSQGGAGTTELRSIVNQATKISGHMDWQDAWQYGQRINDLADLLEKKVAAGTDAKLVELIEQAITQSESGLEQVDDSNGEVYPAIEHLCAVHLQACRKLKPDPVALADRLFRYQMDGGSDSFYQILPTYDAALGEHGLARYRHRVEEQWNTLPPLTPRDASRNWDSRRNRLETAMAEMAIQRGDINALVAIKTRDLSSPLNFLRLAELLREHQRFDEALAWAEQGMTAFPNDHRQDDLIAFAIDEYLRRKNPDTVEKLAWERFERQPDCASFFLLLKVAKQIGRLDALRRKAFEHLEARVATEEGSEKKPSPWAPCARNTLVEIHLTEENADAMWATLTGGPTSTNLWEKCAKIRGKTHPEDAIALYFKLLPMRVEAGTHKARYEDAFRIVKAIGQLRKAQKAAPVFQQELANIRLEYKAKRNFIKALSVLG